jgi:transglutaminase-like putative cysteine protease
MRDEALPRAGGSSIRLALLLALLATLLFETVSGDGERSVTLIALIVAGELAAVVGLGFIARRWEGVAFQEGRSRLVWVLCLATAPFVVEVLIRSTTNGMLPLELLLLAHFRNTVLALSVFAYRPDCQRMACSLSTFLAIFASALATQLWLHGLVVAFALVGIWWLMGTYWETLQGRLAATSQRELSRPWLIAIPALALLVLAGLPAAGMQTRVLRGFMPSSGGSDRYSESARSGVGDGDNLVAGTENIQSFAPIEDAPFLTSHEPSLYDLFDDSYNEPVQPRKPDRAIPLAPQLRTQRPEQELAASRQAGKQFSTLRKFGKPKLTKIGDRNSPALLYVKGRVPLHLKLEVFDQYDGIDWFPEELPEHSPQLTMETLHGRPWLRLPAMRSLDIYGAPETHALKIIRLNTNRVPAPSQLLGIHVDQLDRADFYLWAQPGVVRMDRDKLPSLLAMQVQSRVVDDRLVPKSSTIYSGGRDAYRQFGDDEQSQRVRKLAQDWTADTPHGWPQIQAVVARLRQEFIHDRRARPPEDCDHTVAHFLLKSRRGPDYQFASATVLLLRSLGYSARLASGLYVQPSRYETRSRHTPVLAEDVHFWPEVYAGAGDWIPLEPTPGYELLSPPPTLGDRVQAALWGSWQFVVAQAVPLALLVAATVLCIVKRHRLADSLTTAIWTWFPARDERGRARQTLQLLDARCRRFGRRRPCGLAPTRWLVRVAACGSDAERTTLSEFVRLAEWASFAPNGLLPPCLDGHALCGDVVRLWSPTRLAPARRRESVPAIEHRHRIPMVSRPRFALGESAE